MEATYNINVATFLGYDDTVTLDALNLPGAATALFDPNATTAPFESVLTIRNTEGLTTDSYDVEVTAQDDTVTLSADITLNVLEAAPLVTTLIPPADTVSPGRHLTLDWEDAVANLYVVEVAEDDAFGTIVYSATVETSDAIVPQNTFAPNQTYYWRVRGENLCGEGPNSAVSSLQTHGYSDILVVDGGAPSTPILSYYTNTLDSMEASYDVWDAGDGAANPPPREVLVNYAAVVWAGGVANGVIETGETALANYLDDASQTGCFFINAQDYHFTSSGITPFMRDYLGVATATDDVQHSEVQGAGVFAGLGPYNLSFPYVNRSDHIAPDATAQIALMGDANGGTSAAVHKETADYRTVFWGFPLEAIPTRSEQALALYHTLEWCAPAAQLSPSLIELNVTVGRDPAACATGNELVVPSGTDVTYCYEVTNTGLTTLTTHDFGR